MSDEWTPVLDQEGRHIGEASRSLAPPADLTEAELWAAIDAAPADAFAESWCVDWGTNRGQGRRRGRMVQGAMSDPPRGVSYYLKILGSSAPLTDAERVEAESMTPIARCMLAKALAVGLRGSDAFLVSDTVGDEALTRAQAFSYMRRPLQLVEVRGWVDRSAYRIATVEFEALVLEDQIRLEAELRHQSTAAYGKRLAHELRVAERVSHQNDED